MDEYDGGRSHGIPTGVIIAVSFFVVALIITIVLLSLYSACAWPFGGLDICACANSHGNWNSATSTCTCTKSALINKACTCPTGATQSTTDGSCTCPTGKTLSADGKTCDDNTSSPPPPPPLGGAVTYNDPTTYYGTNQGHWNSPNVSRLLCNADSNDYIKSIYGYYETIPPPYATAKQTETTALGVMCSSGTNPNQIGSQPTGSTRFDVQCADGFTELDVRAGYGLTKVDPWCDGTPSSIVTMSTADGGTLSNFQCPSGQKLRGIVSHAGTLLGDVGFICN